MNYVLHADQFWPSPNDSLGVQNGTILPADRIRGDRRLAFEGDFVVATPGWVNAHAHLELTGSPDIEFNGNFVDWIYDVLDFKQNQDETGVREAYRRGRMDLLRSGVCHVVDHCDRTDWVLDTVETLPAGTRLHKELIAYSPERQSQVLAGAKDFLNELTDRGLPGGLAPHAPYSAHPDLYARAGELCDRVGGSLSSHLHEVEAELQYARSSEGPFAELQQRRAGEVFNSPYPGRPLADLVEAGCFDDPWFGVHMNYLSDSDFRWLRASRIHPVFCPRSYRYFGHGTLPVADWLEGGLAFGLGTDSTASNEGLDMIEELRLLNELLEPGDREAEEILRALTVYPTRVLHEPDRGVLTSGTPADFSLFDVPSKDVHDLARGRAKPLGVVHEGRLAWVCDERLVESPA